MYRLLIIEDDVGIAGAIGAQAALWDMQVCCVRNFRDVMAEFAGFDPHIVLLDISLPFFNGYHWCSEIRKVSKVPIIFISSASDNLNMVMAMNLGADDFIAKPFDQSVLMAKLQALLRRTYDFGASQQVLGHYVFRECDLDEIVKDAVKKFSAEFIGRKPRLVYAPLHTAVVTDEKWLSFVIEQVLSNALKYTPSGSITISLVGEKTLRIQDTGIGIAPSDLPRIFENGYTGFNGRLDKRASGLGFYLCRRVCTQLGHSITASSVIGEGTAIDIDLSQARVEPE